MYEETKVCRLASHLQYKEIISETFE